MKEKIWYLGKELKFNREVETIDEAQAFIDYFKSRNKLSACLHENGKHQVYAEF
jgi:hypothetical protein